MLVKLNDVVDRITGNEDRLVTTLPFYLAGEHYDSESIGIYKRGELNSTTVGKLGFKFHFPFKKGDTIFMSRNAHLKKAGMVMYDGICSDTSYILRTKDEKVLLHEYLPLVIQNEKFWRFFEENKSGSVNFLLNWKEMKEYEFELPAVEEQRKIVEEVWAIENAIKKYEKLMVATDELVKSQFIEMFGCPTNNIKDYKISTLKDIAIGSLSYGSTSAAVDYDGRTRYVRITDITDDGRLNDDIKSAAKTDDKYLLSDGDILFARTGATVGKTARYRETFGRAIYAGFLIRLIPDQSLVLPDYVFHFTKSDYYLDFVKETQRVVAQPNINAQEYGDLMILVPPMEQQRSFVEFVEQSDKSKFELKNCIDSAKETMQAIIATRV